MNPTPTSQNTPRSFNLSPAGILHVESRFNPQHSQPHRHHTEINSHKRAATNLPLTQPCHSPAFPQSYHGGSTPRSHSRECPPACGTRIFLIQQGCCGAFSGDTCTYATTVVIYVVSTYHRRRVCLMNVRGCVLPRLHRFPPCCLRRFPLIGIARK